MNVRLSTIALTALTAVLAVPMSAANAQVAGGVKWRLQQTPDVDRTTFLQDVSCATGRFCIAVGGYNDEVSDKTYALRWDGSDWTRMTTPPDPFGDSIFHAVACPTETMCMALGRNKNHQFAERWDGTTWTVEDIPVPQGAHIGLGQIACPSETECFAVGAVTWTRFPYPFVERWDGSQWSVAPTPLPYDAVGVLEGVSCPATTFCMALGTGRSAEVVETWDGSTWRLLSSRPGNGLGAVACTSATACTAVGYYIPGTTDVERWDGSTWSVQSTPTPQKSSLTAVSCPASDRCFIAGYSVESDSEGVAFAEKWDGTAWTLQPAPGGSGSHLYGISCTGVKACTTVGEITDLNSIETTLADRYSR